MKLEVEIADASSAGAKVLRCVEWTRAGGRFEFRIDGRIVEADVAEIGGGIYSFLACGRSIEVRVDSSGSILRISAGGREFVASVRDPRRFRKGSGAVLSEGRQQITASMPGKVIRVLVQAGEKVKAGQGIVVVEAMKMQNEVKSPKAGSIEKLFVTEGQAVNAGDALAVVV